MRLTYTCLRTLLFFAFWGSVFTAQAQRIGMVDIKGHRDSFVLRFEQQLGFKRIADEQKKVVMRGTLNGEAADLIVFETPITQRVYKVQVRFQAFPKWKTAKEYYLNKLASLETRHGQAVKRVMHFEKPYCDGGGKEFQALKKGKAKYYHDWGDMPYNQNLFLQYWIDADQHVYVSFTLKDEFMKFEEEDKLIQNGFF
jgi:hypothetical protein